MSSDLAASDPIAEIRQLDEPCRIGVIADTHIYDGGRRRLPDGVLRLFARADVDLLVHLGDANVMSVLEELGSLAPLIAVPGNNDEPDIHFLLDETVTFSAGERTFGVLHGHGGRSARIEAARRFAGKVDCVLFGHSHQPMIDRKRDTILFNPGSATDRRFAEHFGIGLIDVADGVISPDLILYQDPDHLDHVDVTRTIVEPISEGTS